MAKVSRKHALNAKELAFCKIFVAFGNKNPTEAYRRSHYSMDNPPKEDPAVTSRKAANLIDRAHIREYIEEIASSPSDHARTALSDMMLFGDEGSSRRAAEQILAQEDKMMFRDAVDNWVRILCEVGAEVVVPLPGKKEVSFPMTKMFPSIVGEEKNDA